MRLFSPQHSATVCLPDCSSDGGGGGGGGRGEIRTEKFRHTSEVKRFHFRSSGPKTFSVPKMSSTNGGGSRPSAQSHITAFSEVNADPEAAAVSSESLLTDKLHQTAISFISSFQIAGAADTTRMTLLLFHAMLGSQCNSISMLW